MPGKYGRSAARHSHSCRLKCVECICIRSAAASPSDATKFNENASPSLPPGAHSCHSGALIKDRMIEMVHGITLRPNVALKKDEAVDICFRSSAARAIRGRREQQENQRDGCQASIDWLCKPLEEAASTLKCFIADRVNSHTVSGGCRRRPK